MCECPIEEVCGLTSTGWYCSIKLMRIFTKTKKNRIFWGIVFFFFAVMMLEIGLRYYEVWRGQKDIEELAQRLEDFDNAILEERANDKIGGNTPQETLDLFIKAVEEGDYDLASKYFVVGKQEKWEKHLPEIVEAGKINVFLEPIKTIKKTNIDIEDRNTFVVHDPVLVSFILYPSGNWKIEEI